jgi:signal transduction histidine kinase/ActR/RegA family two-component response regulator
MREKILKEGKLRNFEASIFTKSGKEIIGLVSAELITLGGKSCVIVVAEDITDRKMMEQEMIKAQKLESVGILAGGIAHDFNNILTGVFGGIQLAKMTCEPDSETHEILAEAEKASLRATDLTRQLLTFAKGGAPVKQITSIEEIIRESAGFALRGSKVRCEFSFPEDLYRVEVDIGQISQVVNNLMINANQAMPDGGVITIGAENLTIRDDKLFPLPKGDYMKFSVQDQGAGISEDNLSKIFDPYFTTKETGSGLGLATSYSIIKRHGGLIEVESEAGKGTTFNIYLPASKGSVIEAVPSGKIAFEGTGRILVVDDDEIVREVLAQMLESLGCEPELVPDGKDGIELYIKAIDDGKPFDAVIMDLTIPGGMGGKEAIKELKDIDPDVKAIVASGYSDDPVMARHEDYGFSGAIAKPYNIEKLGEILYKVINSK